MGDYLENQEISQSVCLINIDSLCPIILSLNGGWIAVITWLGEKKESQIVE